MSRVRPNAVFTPYDHSGVPLHAEGLTKIPAIALTISSISFGEERPAATCQDEIAWARNCRSEFL